MRAPYSYGLTRRGECSWPRTPPQACSGGVLALSFSQAALNSAIAGARSSADPIGKPPGSDLHAPQPSRRQAFVGEADPADALAAFEHADSR